MSETLSMAEDTFENIYISEEVKKSTRSKFEERLRLYAKDRFDKFNAESDPQVRLRYRKELEKLRKDILEFEKRRLARARKEAKERFRSMTAHQKFDVAESYVRQGIEVDATRRFMYEMADKADRQGAFMDDMDKRAEKSLGLESDNAAKDRLAAKELPVEYDMSASDYAEKRKKSRSKEGREAERNKGCGREIPFGNDDE